MKINGKISLGIVLVVFLVSCVPLKQYNELSKRNRMMEEEMVLVNQNNDRLNVQNKELSSELSRLKVKIASLLEDTTRLSRNNETLKYRLDELHKNYQEALAQLNGGGGDEDNAKLLAFLQKLQSDIQKREDDLMLAERELANKKRALLEAENELAEKSLALKTTKGSLTEAEKQMAAQTQRLLQLEEALKRKDQAMQDLKNKMTAALNGFSGDDLKVHMKNGLVYVSMEEKLLFQSGKYDVNAQGADALKKIAAVLAQNKEIDVIVEGHTDVVPYKSQVLQDNWDLSVKRATSVVRILLTNAALEPKRISATGRAEFLPLVDGATKEAYQKNRRTEIILTPQLDKLLNLLESH